MGGVDWLLRKHVFCTRAFIELDELWGQAQASDYSTHSRRVWAFWFFRQAHGRPLSTRGWGVDWLLRKRVFCTRAFIELDELWGQAQASDYSTHSRRVWAFWFFRQAHGRPLSTRGWGGVDWLLRKHVFCTRAFIELDELWGQAQASDYSTHSRRVWAFWFFRQAHGRPLSTRGWGVDWLLRKHVFCTRAFIELDELWGQAQASDYSTHSRRVWAFWFFRQAHGRPLSTFNLSVF
ncbi:Hypothetical_protein [Hexamita inflata]|uniref:Hypothetical_protein n=1 Tax=Hexamita inflata TaxID=28002 RepID=A0AA86VLI4_9EUKA|nr:Hypothetical protein HINF_LOCUS57798 [Hexamita inflata]